MVTRCSASYLKYLVLVLQKSIDDHDQYREVLTFGKLLGIKSLGKKKIDRLIAEYIIDLYLRDDNAFMYLNRESITYDLTIQNYKDKLNVLG